MRVFSSVLLSCLTFACSAPQTPSEPAPPTEPSPVVSRPFAQEQFDPETLSLPVLTPEQVLVVGVLDALEPRFAWHDSWLSADGMEFIDDGESPLASLTLVWPSERAGHALSLLFRVGGEAPQLPENAALGQAFALVLPADALENSALLVSNGLLAAMLALE